MYEIRGTKFKLMSNIERQLKNEEVEIRESYESRISTNKVYSLGSRFLLLPNVEHRTLIEE